MLHAQDLVQDRRKLLNAARLHGKVSVLIRAERAVPGEADAGAGKRKRRDEDVSLDLQLGDVVVIAAAPEERNGRRHAPRAQ